MENNIKERETILEKTSNIQRTVEFEALADLESTIDSMSKEEFSEKVDGYYNKCLSLLSETFSKEELVIIVANDFMVNIATALTRRIMQNKLKSDISGSGE